MPLYGVLKSNINTGLDSELACVFAAPLAITSNQPSLSADTMTLRRVGSSQGVQRWEVTATIQPSDDPTDMFTNMLLSGHSEYAYLRCPQLQRRNKEMEAGLNIRANGNFFVGDSTLNLTNASTLLKGEFIRFKNHSKVYFVVNPGTVGVGVQVHPPLLAYVPTTTEVEYGATTTLRVKYDSDTILGMSYEDGILASPGQRTFVEAL